MAFASENYVGTRRRRRRPPVVGENAADKAAIQPQGTTRTRYTDVVRGAQQTIAQQYADDPVTGRIPARPGGTRHRETTDTLTRQAFGYGFGAASLIPGPTQLPFAGLSALALSTDPSTREQFRGAKQRVDVARGSGDKSDVLRSALDFSLITGAVGVGPGGGLPGRRTRAEIEAEIESIKADPASWDYRDGMRFLKGNVARRFDELQSELGKRSATHTPKPRPDRVERSAAEQSGSGKPRPAGAEKIVEALPEARRIRAKQQAGYRAERGKRGAAAEAAFEHAGGGQAGHIAAKAELKGELPKLPFDRLMKEFGAADSELRAVHQPQVDEMLNTITGHFAGKKLTAVRARDALLKALDGQTPQKSEIRLLEQVFGEEAAQHFKWRAARERALKLANVPRSMQASYDLSLGLRQLLVAGVRHPVVWQRVMRAQIQAARSQKAADAWLDAIRADPRYDQMIDDGVKLTDIKVRPGQLEEDFIGAEYAERIPVVGRPVKWSTRAFTVGGAKMRADLYNLFMDQAERAGETLTKRERRDFASVINAATGRGGMGLDVLERAAPLGTVLLFSPRLIASRLAFLNPLWYAKLSGPARKEAASSYLSVLALGSAVLWLAEQLGAEVETDPRSADFGKIQVGDTRVDIWGGFQQYVVNGYRYAVAETKSPDGEVKDKTREEILWNFASGKAAPLPGLARDLQRGRSFNYQPIDAPLAGVPYGSAVGKLFVPFNIQNAWDAKEDPKLAAASFGLGGIGLGVQTYESDEKKPVVSSVPSADSYRSSRSRGGGYRGGGGYTGGNYASR